QRRAVCALHARRRLRDAHCGRAALHQRAVLAIEFRRIAARSGAAAYLPGRGPGNTLILGPAPCASWRLRRRYGHRRSRGLPQVAHRPLRPRSVLARPGLGAERPTGWGLATSVLSVKSSPSRLAITIHELRIVSSEDARRRAAMPGRTMP